MRLADALLRQGHLSERAIVDALMTGDRPLHLERCDICGARAVEMNRWLDAVKAAAIDAADEVFPAERLAAQHAQIQRRLAQLDEPARVIAFPGQSRLDPRDGDRRRVAPGWLGVAAAAGLVVGVIGGQLTARINPPPAPVQPAAATTAPAQETDRAPIIASWVDPEDVDAFMPQSLHPLNEMTPRVVMASAR